MKDATGSRAAILHDHDSRMAIVRRIARWHLGNGSWADLLVGAYNDPEPALERLEKAQAKYDR